MRLFNSTFQQKVLNLFLVIYSIATIFYLLVPLQSITLTQIRISNLSNTVFLVIAITILFFRNKIHNTYKGFFIAFIFSFSGFIDNYYLDSYKGYFFCILAIGISALTLKKNWAIIVWSLTISGLIAIGILKKFGIISNAYSALVMQTTWAEWIEKTTIFTLISGIMTLVLSNLRNYVTQLIQLSYQEQIKYKPLFDQTYSFITILDSAGKVLESNQAALYYIRSTNEKVLNTYFPETDWWNHSKDSKEIIEKNLQASMNGDFRRFEVSLRNKDGDVTYFDYTLKPIFDDNSEQIKLIIAEGRSISDIKKAKQALIESEERLLALTEGTYEGLIITNGGILVEANKSFQRLLKIENLEEVLGKNTIEIFIHNEDKPIVYDKIEENYSRPYEVRAIRMDGKEIHVELEGRDIIYKGLKHRISAIRDLTERRLAQKALINSEEKYRLITENINDIICKLDGRLRFTYASTSVYNMLGYTVSEMEQISLREITDKESYSLIINFLNQKKKLIQKNDPDVWNSVSFEAILKHKSGKLLWSHINAKLVKWGKDNNYEILCVARNIDAIKKIQFTLEENENRLKRQNEEYEQLNKELTVLNEKLLQAKYKAEESDKLKSAFLANMSHEIRTPMNSIIGFSKMFKSKDIDDHKRERYADFVINNGKLLLNIVNDILDLSKIESGQIMLKKTVFNLNEMIEELFTEISNQNTKGLMLIRSKELDDADSFIYNDRNRLMQVLSNLTNNALKFTKKGGIKFGYQLLNDSIIFFVEDTGIGIPIELQDKIFERFRQVELDASRVFGGAGLGLSISKQLVQLMNGKIWLVSESGVGSTFYISIPYTKSKSEAEVISTPIIREEIIIPKVNPKDTSKTVLVAEDDESNFFYLHELLSEQNLNVLRAKNGLEAVDVCTNNPNIDIVFMDIKMPVMDGFEATKRIKQIRPRLPIIAQTAFAMADDKDTAIKQGCDDYMSKPIDPEVIFNMISKHLQK